MNDDKLTIYLPSQFRESNKVKCFTITLLQTLSNRLIHIQCSSVWCVEYTFHYGKTFKLPMLLVSQKRNSGDCDDFTQEA